MDVKPPKTYAEQVALIKDKGFIVDNDLDCIEFLKKANYYRLSAYYLPFRLPDGTYFPDTPFKRIQGIYEFDQQIRSILLANIEEIELYLRTQISYYFSHLHGPLGYMDSSFFNGRHNDNKFKKGIKNCISANSRSLVVRHHVEKYGGQFPLWVIIEYFSLGMISHFYADMLPGEKKELAKNVFNTGPQYLSSWLRCITDLRNLCAHYARLYYWHFAATPKIPTAFPYKATRRLFPQLLVFKFLYPDRDTYLSKLVTPLSVVLEKYQAQISLKHIDFPENWEDLLLL